MSSSHVFRVMTVRRNRGELLYLWPGLESSARKFAALAALWLDHAKPYTIQRATSQIRPVQQAMVGWRVVNATADRGASYNRSTRPPSKLEYDGLLHCEEA